MTEPRLAKGRWGRRYVWPPTGDEVPSVTTILNQKAKPALKHWAAKMVATYAVENILGWQDLPPDDAIDLLKREPLRYTAGRANIGSAVHAALEAWTDNGEIPMVEPDLLPYIAGGVQFLDDHVDTVLHSEVTVFNLTYQYAGTVDLICKLKDGRTAIADWKSGKALYEETALQLCAYANGEFIAHHNPDTDEWTPLELPHIDVAVGVHIPGDAGYTAKTTLLTPRLFKTFIALRTLQAWEDNHKDDVWSDEWTGQASA